MTKSATPLPQDPPVEAQKAPVDVFAEQRAEAEKAGSKAVMDMPTLIKGAVPCLRVDH